jgi:hypothetical protein
MDNEWGSVLQYIGDLDLEYNEKVGQADDSEGSLAMQVSTHLEFNEKVGQADEGSIAMQVPTPPVSIGFFLFFWWLKHPLS